MLHSSSFGRKQCNTDRQSATHSFGLPMEPSTFTRACFRLTDELRDAAAVGGLSALRRREFKSYESLAAADGDDFRRSGRPKP